MFFRSKTAIYSIFSKNSDKNHKLEDMKVLGASLPQTIAVKNGFSIGAFILTMTGLLPLYLFFKKEFVAGLGAFAILLFIVSCSFILPVSSVLEDILKIMLAIWLGFEATKIQQYLFSNRGFILTDIVIANSALEAQNLAIQRQMALEYHKKTKKKQPIPYLLNSHCL